MHSRSCACQRLLSSAPAQSCWCQAAVPLACPTQALEVSPLRAPGGPALSGGPPASLLPRPVAAALWAGLHSLIKPPSGFEAEKTQGTNTSCCIWRRRGWQKRAWDQWLKCPEMCGAGRSVPSPPAPARLVAPSLPQEPYCQTDTPRSWETK